MKTLITMSPGFPGTFTSLDLMGKKDALKFIFDLPLAYRPGTRFIYNNASPHLVSAIIKKTTGSDTLDYAGKKLFEPLDLSVSTWAADQEGIHNGGAGLCLTPFEMYKFGYLYLRDGVWNGNQIVPEEWVKTSTLEHISRFNMNTAERSGYGYFWWMNSFGGFSAHGNGGQYLFVIPKLDMVAVFTGNLVNKDFTVPYKLMKDYIVPATTSKPLPENPLSQSELYTLTKEFEEPQN